MKGEAKREKGGVGGLGEEGAWQYSLVGKTRAFRGVPSPSGVLRVERIDRRKPGGGAIAIQRDCVIRQG